MPHPGDIVLVNFPGAQGIKRRPAVVLSTNLYHAARPDAIVGVLTSQVAKSTSSTDHLLNDWSTAGLKKPTAFRAYFATIDRAGVYATLGRPSPRDWDAIKDCVRRSIEL